MDFANSRPDDASMRHNAKLSQMNECWIIVNGPTENIFQWNLNETSTILIEENEFENVVRKMPPICRGLNVF